MTADAHIVAAHFLGTRLNPCTNAAAVDFIFQNVKEGGRGHICISNVDALTRARTSAPLRNIFSAALLVLMDGMPLVWAMRIKGIAPIERNYGPEFMLLVCQKAAQLGTPIFLYGGMPDELAMLLATLAKKMPRLLVAGAVSPPRLPACPPEDIDICGQINRSGARIVFIGLGCPKQEFWMGANSEKINAICLGVGLAFAQNAGMVKRAPALLQRFGMEWLFRLVQEPRRLWRRYLVGNTVFLIYVFTDLMRAASQRAMLFLSPKNAGKGKE